MPILNVQEQLEREWRQGAPASGNLPPAEAVIAAARRPAGPIALYADLEDIRVTFVELRASPALVQDAEAMITSQWRLRDLLAHMASWAHEIRREAEVSTRGDAFDYRIPFTPGVGPTEWNHREVDARRELPLDAIFDEFVAETRRLEHLVLALPAETLNAHTEFPPFLTSEPPALMWMTVSDMVTKKCGHDRLHLARIAAWQATRRKA